MKKTVRRPIKSRNTKWAAAIAKFLAKIGLKPNYISILSVVFAGLAGASLFYIPLMPKELTIILYLLAILFIQLRLLCNLFDGMVAIEGGFKTKSGEIFNDLPDRIADPIILVCAGYSLTSINYAHELGWLAGLLAIMTAYIRLLGGTTGATQLFIGPMAKQHRMAVMTFALLVAAIVFKWNYHEYIITGALSIIVLGCIVTIMRRTIKIIQELENK
jgi:phosphatidylglycerophosphate synthase